MLEATCLKDEPSLFRKGLQRLHSGTASSKRFQADVLSALPTVLLPLRPQVVCEATQSANTQVRVAALQCLVKIMSLYYQYMEHYMGPALFAVSDWTSAGA